jgi:hypothetical protein
LCWTSKTRPSSRRNSCEDSIEACRWARFSSAVASGLPYAQFTGLTRVLIPAAASCSRVASPFLASKPPDQCETTRSGLAASTCSAGTSKLLFVVRPPVGRALMAGTIAGSSETP